MGKAKASTATAKKALTKKKQPKAKRVVKDAKPVETVRPKKSSDDSWKSVMVVGEHPENVKRIHQGPHPGIQWDFSHLHKKITSLLIENPDKDIYVVGGSPEMLDCKTQVFSAIVAMPVMHLILVDSGHQPPELIALQDFQHGKEKIVPFRNMKFSWQSFTDCPTFQNRVFKLRSLERGVVLKTKKEADLIQNEYSGLYIQVPSRDWGIDKNGKLDVRHAMFTYKPSADAERIDEEFDKDSGHRLKQFIPDFVERHDLDESHYDKVKAAIVQGFDQAREYKAKTISLFKNYDKDVLDSIEVVKLYPKNSFVPDSAHNSYVNAYYPKASSTL